MSALIYKHEFTHHFMLCLLVFPLRNLFNILAHIGIISCLVRDKIVRKQRNINAVKSNDADAVG